MRYDKKKSLVYLTMTSVLAMSLVAFVLEKTEADEGQAKEFSFASDVSITVDFEYQNGDHELTNFESYTQKSGFSTSDPPIFVLEKIVGDTPILHHLADELQSSSRSVHETRFFFDTKVMLHKDGKVIREFDYDNCLITEYEVRTDYDKEEGWMNKSGFAVIDSFVIECDGYSPRSPVYDEMIKPVVVSAPSTKDLGESTSWSPSMRAK